MAGEGSGDGDIFVEGFLVKSAAADADLFALLRGGAEEAGAHFTCPSAAKAASIWARDGTAEVVPLPIE